MNDQMQELSELIQLKDQLIKDKKTYSEDFRLFKMVKKVNDSLPEGKMPKMPMSLAIRMNGFSKMEELIQTQLDAMIAEVDSELATYETRKQA